MTEKFVLIMTFLILEYYNQNKSKCLVLQNKVFQTKAVSLKFISFFYHFNNEEFYAILIIFLPKNVCIMIILLILLVITIAHK